MFLSKLYRCLEVREGGRKRGGREGVRGRKRGGRERKGGREREGGRGEGRYTCIYFILFQRKVFEGLAQEAVSECVLSLHSASNTIQSKKV